MSGTSFQVFFWDGRVICGPDPRGLILTAMTVFLSEWCFLALVVDGSSSTHPILVSGSSLILATTVSLTSHDVTTQFLPNYYFHIW
jgi:palmitoyltransferase ZDHHC9/14/18